jgi:hypothetical protein
MMTRDGESHTQICRYFRKGGGCPHGSRCRFKHSHEESRAVAVSAVSDGLCDYIRRNMQCPYFPRCKYKHWEPAAGNSLDRSSDYPSTPQQKAGDNDRLITNLTGTFDLLAVSDSIPAPAEPTFLVGTGSKPGGRRPFNISAEAEAVSTVTEAAATDHGEHGRSVKLSVSPRSRVSRFSNIDSRPGHDVHSPAMVRPDRPLTQHSSSRGSKTSSDCPIMERDLGGMLGIDRAVSSSASIASESSPAANLPESVFTPSVPSSQKVASTVGATMKSGHKEPRHLTGRYSGIKLPPPPPGQDPPRTIPKSKPVPLFCGGGNCCGLPVEYQLFPEDTGTIASYLTASLYVFVMFRHS